MEEDFPSDEYLLEVTTEPSPREKYISKQFISCYKSLPELWDTNNSYYTHKGTRLKAIIKLTNVYRKMKRTATTQDTRKKINSLRSNYRRELRKVMASRCSANDTGYVYKPKWAYFNMLHFLNNFDPPVSPKEEHVEVEYLDSGDPTDSISIRSFSSNSSIQRKQVVQRQENIDETVIDLNYSTQASNQSENTSVNVHPTALYWGVKLENLDPTQRIFAEKAINDILFEAELGTLTRHSVQINARQTEWKPSVDSSETTNVLSPENS